MKTLLILLAVIGAGAGFTVTCWLAVEFLMKLCGKDPRI